MKKVKMLTVCLLAGSMLFAADNKGKSNLGFSQGDNEFAFGALMGWDGGFGVPLVWEIGAINGMLSFGGELRFWGQTYSPDWNWYNGYGLQFHHTQTDEQTGAWLYDEYRYYDHNVYVPVYRHTPSGYYYVNGDKYSPYSGRKLVKLGWSPAFRAMFHPFGIPALKGKVNVAKVLDPYAGIKFGFSVINYDKDDPWRQNEYSRDVDFPVFAPVAGLRWYFKNKVSLWTEFAMYDFSLGFSFKF